MLKESGIIEALENRIAETVDVISAGNNTVSSFENFNVDVLAK